MSRDHQQVGVSADDLHVLARLGQRTGSLQEDEAKAIANVLTLRDRPVQDIMTPRTVVFSLNVAARVGEIREQEDIYYHSRIPVFDQDADDVVGMVHRRDLMAAMARQQCRSSTLYSECRKASKSSDSFASDRMADSTPIARGAPSGSSS